MRRILLFFFIMVFSVSAVAQKKHHTRKKMSQKAHITQHARPNQPPVAAIESPQDEDDGSFRDPLIFRFGRYQESFNWERNLPPPLCNYMTEVAILACQRVRSAEVIAGKVPLSIYKGKAGDIRRDFALVALDQLGNWHTVMLNMRVDGRHSPDVEVKTDGYTVAIVRGTSLNQMVYDVHHGDDTLAVYAAKHLSIPIGTDKKKLLSLKFNTEPVLYIATPDYLNFAEFAVKGKAYARAHVNEALQKLRVLRVPSKAYPGKLVADVVSDNLLLTLLAIEQSDPYRMFGEHNERLLSGDTSEEVVNAVFARFMFNGLRAYHYICSSKAACGGFQFTNGGRLGTYDLVRAEYPNADLDPNFVRGSLSFINGAKAAALLVDLELSNKRLPDAVRDLYLRDQRFGALFPVAAYNGGASQSLALAKLYQELQIKQRGKLTLDTIPWDWEPLVRSYSKGKPLKKETAVYLRKFQITSGLIYYH